MKIEFNLFASLNQYMPELKNDQPNIMDFESGSSVQDILELLSVPVDQVKLIFVNGVRGKPDYQLQEGDRLGVFPAVAGG
ncbi:MAG: MoaD/ThiS family protein [Deltaproteobacteria bacterium]|jgi:sulfur-carrier protein|nr:MoaD/ThiS family protein [Deltaproteobacteria bacterium]